MLTMAEDVINAEGVEIISHLRETAFPPREAIGRHARPIVSGEAPVLTFRRKRIRRCARLHIQVEEFRRLFAEAVTGALEDGVPAWGHLSGGLDSSSVVGMASPISTRCKGLECWTR